MDGASFDTLVKRLTQTRLTRVAALRGVLASAAVGVMGTRLAAGTEARKRGDGKDKDKRKEREDVGIVLEPCVNGTCANPELPVCCKGTCIPGDWECCPEASHREYCFDGEACCQGSCIKTFQGDFCCEGERVCEKGEVCCDGFCHGGRQCLTCCNGHCSSVRGVCCGDDACESGREVCCQGAFCIPSERCLPGTCGRERVCGPGEQCCPGFVRCCRTDETCCHERCCVPGQVCQDGACVAAQSA